MSGIPDGFDLTDSLGRYDSASADGPVGGEDEFDRAFRAPRSQPSDGGEGPSSSSDAPPSFGGDDLWAQFDSYTEPSSNLSSDQDPGQYGEPVPSFLSYAPLSFGGHDPGAQFNSPAEPSSNLSSDQDPGQYGEPVPSSSSYAPHSFGEDDLWAQFDSHAGPSSSRSSDQYFGQSGEPVPSSSSYAPHSFGEDDLWAQFDSHAGPSSSRSSDQYFGQSGEPVPSSSSYAPHSFGEDDLWAQFDSHAGPLSGRSSDQYFGQSGEPVPSSSSYAPLSFGWHDPVASYNPFEGVPREHYTDPGEGRGFYESLGSSQFDYESQITTRASTSDGHNPAEAGTGPSRSDEVGRGHSPSELGPADVTWTRSQENPFRGADKTMILPPAMPESGVFDVFQLLEPAPQQHEPAPTDALESGHQKNSRITWTNSGREWVRRQKQARRNRTDVIRQFLNDMEAQGDPVGSTKVYRLFKEEWPTE